MPQKTHGEDDGGKYVLWENRNSSGQVTQINKKYYDGPNKGEHIGHNTQQNRDFMTFGDHPRGSHSSLDTSRMSPSDKKYVENLRSRGYSDSDIESKMSSSSGGCYIATASLQGRLSYESLRPLKLWRYAVLETSHSGMKFSQFYRENAVPVAEKVERMPFVSLLLRNLFVRPSLYLASREEGKLRDALLTALFLAGMVAAYLLTAFEK